MQVVYKLQKALRQKHQLNLQQTSQVGKVLCGALKAGGQEEDNERQPYQVGRSSRLTEVLDQAVDIGVSSSTMEEAMAVFTNLQKLPILSYSNEPVSHLASSEVKKALPHVADIMHRDGQVSEKLHDASVEQSAYDVTVPQHGLISLSPPIDVNTICINDGDGVVLQVDRRSNDPVGQDSSAVHTRLNRIDAPELFAIHYVRNDETQAVLEQFKGHLSMLNLRFFVDLFVRNGTANLCYQLPRNGRNEPTDPFGRPLKEFWFEYRTAPNNRRELEILDAIIRTSQRLDAEDKAVLMSSFDPRQATEVRPFYLSLNALLVFTGNCHVFTRFCHDRRMLALQNCAKENRIGPLYCGLTKNYVVGYEVDIADDFFFAEFMPIDVERLRRAGYPDWLMDGNNCTGLLPWHERAMKHRVKMFSRTETRDHLAAPFKEDSPSYGFYINIDRWVFPKQLKQKENDASS